MGILIPADIVTAASQIDISTPDGVAAWFRYLWHTALVAWHPDEQASSLVDNDTGEPCLTPEDASVWQARMDQAWQVCEAAGVDIYELGMRSTVVPHEWLSCEVCGNGWFGDPTQPCPKCGTAANYDRGAS